VPGRRALSQSRGGSRNGKRVQILWKGSNGRAPSGAGPARRRVTSKLTRGLLTVRSVRITLLRLSRVANKWRGEKRVCSRMKQVPLLTATTSAIP
jgi:hypothetical protein